jgi:VWFA-related protein
MQIEKQNPESRIQKPEGRRLYYVLLTAYCLLLTAYCSAVVRAQDEPPPPPQPPNAHQRDDGIETVRINTELVDLNVSVFNRNPKRPVGELKLQDFAVMENGAPEEISFFASAEAPFDLVLLLDLSGSSVDKLSLIRKSAIRFVEAARPADRISVITFTDMPAIVSPPTTDRKELIERIKKIEKPHGGTDFWDSLGFVLKGVLGKSDSTHRQAVIVMSDGVDNALPDVPGPGSDTTFEQLIEMVKMSDAIIIPIYLDTEQEMLKKHLASETSYTIARQQLSELAGESGSILYHARKLEDLNGVYEQVIRDLGTVYSIGYHPTNKRRDGSWRTVSVQLVNRPELAARTRRGYYAK